MSKPGILHKPKYPVPVGVTSIMTYKCNPLSGSQPLTDNIHQWTFESSLFTKQKYERIRGTTMFVDYFWSFCSDPARYEVLTKVVLNLFVLDDHMETRDGDIGRQEAEVEHIWGQLYGVYDKLLAPIAGGTGDGQHVSAHHWKPYVLAAYAIHDEVLTAFNDVQKRRFVDVWREWTDGMVAECVDLDRKRVYKSIDEFFAVRQKSVALMLIYQLIEYADNLYVPEPEWRNPTMRSLFTTLERLDAICNDMYSFEKELMDADGCPHRTYNCVAVLAQMENISLTESMNRWVTEFRDLGKKALDLSDEILGSDWASPDTRVFVGHVMYCSGGHWKASTMVDRYNTLTIPKTFDY